MREALTDRKIETAKIPDGKKYLILKDSKLSGFQMRINQDGSRTFIFRGRVNGRERQITIGRFPDWSVLEARKMAGEYARQMDNGIDPTLEREKLRLAPTFTDAFEELYWSQHLSKRNAKAQKDERSMFTSYMAPLAEMRLTDITPRDCQKIHYDMTMAEKPIRANRVLQVMRSVFNRAIEAGWLTHNPTKAIKKNHEKPRERFLSREEQQRLIDAIKAHPNKHAADIISLLMLTGARRGETLKATWDQFDLEAGVWMKPSHHTKQKRIHTVPLSPAAIVILKSVKARSISPFVFPQLDNAGKPTVEFRHFWKDVLATAGIKDFRVHDLRHHYATVLASNGLSLPIIGQLLGHTQQATTQRYAHLMVEPLREATTKASQIIDLFGEQETTTERTVQ